jgi:regulator of protease activity HflC (stomatin/prohibitin superfamily)
MRQLATIFLLVVVMLATTGCIGCTRIGPGYAGIVVNLAGDARGVDEIPIETGWLFFNPITQQVMEYPTHVKSYAWTADSRQDSPNNEEISFNSKNGLEIKADISMSYRIEEANIPAFYVKFRNDNIDRFTDGYMRNSIRDAFQRAGNDYTADEIYGPLKDQLVDTAEKLAQDQLSELGVVIEQFGFIGAPRPPGSVLTAIEDRVKAVQRAERAKNELQLMQAEADKKVATAEGDLQVSVKRAEQNRVLASSISDRLIQWRQLELTQQYLEKWDGNLPNVMVGSGENNPMIFQIPNQ